MIEQIRQDLQQALSPARYQHVLRVEETAVQLARHYGEDPARAQLAALLHDLYKEAPPATQLELAEAYLARTDCHLAIESAGTAIWHGLAAAEWAVRHYQITDQSVLQAVAWHTTGWYEMDRLAQIIYTADYIEPGRDFDAVHEARRLSEIDLEQATRYQMRHQLIHLLQTEREVFVESVKIYNHWLHH